MSGLLDFFQSASNTAAENVSAPVDGLAWLLRKAGVPVGETPVGGSNWMREKGLTRPVSQSPASLAGETFGLLSPIVASAKAPQIAGGLLQAVDNAMKPSTMNSQAGAIVWHGSPYKFDKFDASKIGTGEGAQAYGHGLYLAEAPTVAKSYVDPLYKARDATQIAGLQYDAFLDNARTAIPTTTKDRALFSKAMAPAQSLEEAAANLAELKRLEPGRDFRNVDALFELASKSGVDFPAKGHLYKVDLPDEAIAKMLDWDKPLSQQAGISIKPVSPDYNGQFGTGEYGGYAWHIGDTQVSRAYRSQEMAQKNAPLGADLIRDLNAEVSRPTGHQEILQKAGIPGIRYLDGGSRGTGQGTSNFVVFPGNEDLLKILERNGQPLGLLD